MANVFAWIFSTWIQLRSRLRGSQLATSLAEQTWNDSYGTAFWRMRGMKSSRIHSGFKRRLKKDVRR